MASSLKNRPVLVIGVDPRTVPGLDVAAIEKALALGQEAFERQGIQADLCLLRIDESAKDIVINQLGTKEYACVVIGGGIRKPEPLLEFFEMIVNLVHRYAPDAAIAFNSNPGDSAQSAMRWLAE